MNSGLVAGIVAIERARSFLGSWGRSLGSSAWLFLTGLSTAVAVLAVIDSALVWGLAIAVPPCWLMATYYRLYARQQREDAS